MTAEELRALQVKLERAAVRYAKLTSERNAAIVAELAAGKTQRQLAAELGISASMVEKVANREAKRAA